MDIDVFREVDKLVPQFNKQLAEGFSYSQLSKMKNLNINGNNRVATVNEQYINELFEQAAKSFPPNLRYVGYSRVSPEEEYNIVTTRKRNAKNYYDIARSDMYLVNYNFTLDGEAIDPVPLYLPFTRRGGIITIKKAKFMISPVIADVALSVDGESIFLMMNRAKLKFEKITCSVFINGIKENPYVMWSQVYNIKDKRHIKTTLTHYLFCKFGVTETLKMLGCSPIFISEEDYHRRKSEFPEDRWCVCTAVGKKTNGRSKRFRPMQTDVVIIIPKEQMTFSIKSAIAAFFYIADVFPERVRMVDYDSPLLWRRFLGKIILGFGESEGKIINQINTHMASVDGYVDAMVSRWLADGGYAGITTIYELFKLLIEIGPTVIATDSENVASLYGKRFVVNRYVNRDIVNGISTFLFSVQKHINAGKQLKPSDVTKLFNINLPYALALRINRQHSEVKSVSSASDCLIHKITSVTLLQTEASNSNSNGPAFGPSKVLDMSISEAAGHSNQPSRDPSGRSSINMCVKTDEAGTILQNQEFKEQFMDKYQAMIKR